MNSNKIKIGQVWIYLVKFVTVNFNKFTNILCKKDRTDSECICHVLCTIKLQIKLSIAIARKVIYIAQLLHNFFNFCTALLYEMFSIKSTAMKFIWFYNTLWNLFYFAIIVFRRKLCRWCFCQRRIQNIFYFIYLLNLSESL